MSGNAVQHLESYRLAQYAVAFPCFICGQGNNFDAETCRHCQAPMALARQAQSEKIPPSMIAVVGSPAAGKTVYLGMLADMLSHENGKLQMLARGAFSVSLQQATMAALARCEFPMKTPSEPDRWNWAHCQIKVARRKRPLEMIMPDLAGEALMEEIDHPYSFPLIRSFLGKCQGVMVLIDTSRVEEGGQDQDFFAMKIVSYLCELTNDCKRGWPDQPIALVFTKADRSDFCFENPQDYARKHTPGLWQLCRERLRRYQYFASTVAGAWAWRPAMGGRVQIPLRIEPRGIVEPFVWVVEELTRK